MSLLVAAPSRHPKVSWDVADLDPDTPVDVIVQFRQEPTAMQHDRLARRGGQFKRDLNVINGSLYRVAAGRVTDIANDPDVVLISPDLTVQSQLDLSMAATNASMALQAGYDGTGVGVAVIDSGISNADDLKNKAGALRVVYSQDFVGGGTDDHYGHGEHVAGILAGNGNRSIGSKYSTLFRRRSTECQPDQPPRARSERRRAAIVS